MSRLSPTSFQIALPLVAVLALLLAFVGGSFVGQGQHLPVIIALAMFGAIFFFLLIDRRYWMLIPMALSAKLPTLPFGGRAVESGEAVIAICTVIFLARLALKKEQFLLFKPLHLPVLLFMGWVVWVWLMNPTGLAVLGSETMGGRFYLKIVLGFCAFMILACQRPSEKDLFWVMALLIGGVLFGLAQDLGFGGRVRSLFKADQLAAHTQVLSAPALAMFFLLFARFKPSEVFTFKKPLLLGLYCLCMLVALFSGKRMALALGMAAPFFATILYKEYRYSVIAGILGLALGSLVLTGHGTYFTFPLSVQRAMSWLPGEWDRSFDRLGINDQFRDELRILAWERIQENPIVGKGYSMNMQEVIRQKDSGGRGSDFKTEGHALSGNWHNRTLGYWADWGFPIVPITVFLFGTVLVTSYRLVQYFPHGTAYQMYCAYAFYTICRMILTSHTSGHTALDVFGSWWVYGLLFAVAAVAKQQQQEAPVQVAEPDASTLPLAPWRAYAKEQQMASRWRGIGVSRHP